MVHISFFFNKISPNHTNPEPRMIGVQKEQSLRPRISAKPTKYRHQLCNPNNMNPSTPNPKSHVTPSSPSSPRNLEERIRSR